MTRHVDTQELDLDTTEHRHPKDGLSEHCGSWASVYIAGLCSCTFMS